MTKPIAYEPAEGYKYQILTRCPGERLYEHCDYATDSKDLKYLLTEYRLAYGPEFSFCSIRLPRKYWNH